MIWIIIGAVCLALDRLTKFYIASTFAIGESIPVIKNVFHITYHLNDGAAFSILQGKRIFLLITTIIILLLLIFYIFIRKPENRLVRLSLCLIISGAIGNFIDRIKTGSVVDFLDFRLINFPIFNVADSLVVIGAACLFIATLKYGEEL